ncbi:MAG: hypothetical protein QXY50_07180 [Candidatus Caldarchaeum sp.]
MAFLATATNTALFPLGEVMATAMIKPSNIMTVVVERLEEKQRQQLCKEVYKPLGRVRQLLPRELRVRFYEEVGRLRSPGAVLQQNR